MNHQNPGKYQLTIRTSQNGNPILVLSHTTSEKEDTWWNVEKIANAITRSTLSQKQKRILFLEGMDLIKKNYTSKFHKDETLLYLQNGLNALDIKKVNSEECRSTFGDLLKAKNISFAFTN